MPLLKNNAKRLITLNGPHTNQKDANGRVIGVKPGDKYDLLPAGAAVDVPQSVADIAYAKALIKTGDIVVVESSSDSDSTSSAYDSMTKNELVEIAESMGIEIESRDTKAQIIDKIESAS